MDVCYFQSYHLSRPSTQVTHRVRQEGHKLVVTKQGRSCISQSLNKSNSSCIVVAPQCLDASKRNLPKLQTPLAATTRGARLACPRLPKLQYTRMHSDMYVNGCS